MAAKVEAKMLSVREALSAGYAELSTIRRELDDWLDRMGPRRRPDTTSRRWFTQSICDDLAMVEAPDFSAILEEVLGRQVCVVLDVGGKSRETRKQNSLAKLRPAVAALWKAGQDSLAAKIGDDIGRVEGTFVIRGAHE